MTRNFDQLPLRERLKHAEQLTRELVEHFEQGFVPKLELARKVTRQSYLESKTDQTIRDHAALVLKSEDFTREVFASLDACLKSIGAEVESMVKTS